MLQVNHHELQHNNTLRRFLQLGYDAIQSVFRLTFAEFAFNYIAVFGVLSLDQFFGFHH